MIEVALPLLAEGLKGWLEDPAFLIGAPLLAIGALGAVVMLTPFRMFPVHEDMDAYDETAMDLIVPEEGHPGPDVYIRIGLILAFITAIEVAIVYVDLIEGLFIGVLLALSALKFVLVVLYFMHLRYDNRFFSTLFTGGFILAMMLFAVVLATLGSSLV
jgi:cytochrome c oxidase subunit IV